MCEYIEYFNGGLFQGGWILFDYMENILYFRIFQWSINIIYFKK